ncbi:MAG: MBL fold metallo-hydrolase [Armatimonadetes bacterium]|nr:MBL fold metallo-hydrolase [Armatimonadota bacterium]CUU34926.1 hydroxyacylglutathione hydrolase [Armatimonadetes bacterium DC]
MIFRQIYEEGLAQASYFFGCPATGEAMVIDPRRDIDVYLNLAQQTRLKIVAVGETHIHADFLSGARELAHATGATLYLSDEGDENWKYRGLEGFSVKLLKDGDEWHIGNIRVRAVHTPGHTPEHITFLLYDSSDLSDPVIAITGDFIFVGDLGRSDLLEEAAGIQGTAEPGARALYKSLVRFLEQPDYLQIWPGHGAGSACGKALGALPATTLGYEKRHAWWAKSVTAYNEEAFVRELLADQPEAPTYFAVMKRLNRDGMPILGSLPQPPLLTPEAFQRAMAEGAQLVDTRDKFAFAGGHIKGAINIPAGKWFSTWAGWLLDYNKPIVLLAAPEQIETLVRQLIRVGLDSIVGYIPSLEGYAPSELETVPQITAERAHEMWKNGEALVVDVRGLGEYREGHIPNALHIHAGRILQRKDAIPKDRPVIVHCLGGDRSSTAISALMAHGYQNLYNLTGGILAWEEHAFPLERA